MGTLERPARQSNFELLRVLCMLSIVALHYTSFSFFIPDDEPVSLNMVILKILSFDGQCGVEIFVLISGYFMVVKGFDVKKTLKFWLQVSIISAVCGLIFYFTGDGSLSLLGLLHAFFPILYNEYWFASTYFVLLLLSGFINSLVHTLSRQRLLALIWILLSLYTILPTFLNARMASSSLLLFVTLYLIAAYIRLYSPKLFESKVCLGIAVGLELLFLAVFIAAYLLSEKSVFLSRLVASFAEEEKAWTFLRAVFIFAVFKNLKLPPSKLINALGASTFGVYLIHSNPYLTHFWWVTLMHGPEYLHSPYLILHAVISIAVVYILCTLLDMLYRYAIEKPMWSFINRHWDTWQEKLLSVISKTNAS